MTDLAEKFRGALVGVAIGDALGAGFEGSASVDATDMTLREQSAGTLRYTDDTHMTLGVAESLVARNGFDGAHMAGLFVERFRSSHGAATGRDRPRCSVSFSRGSRGPGGADPVRRQGLFRQWRGNAGGSLALFAYHDVDRLSYSPDRPPSSPTPTSSVSRARCYRHVPSPER
jgi:poly(ADP-ribose) glycohydrolase ARH3